MEDREFVDFLYQGWSQTTGAADKFWMPEQDSDVPYVFHLYAVDEGRNKHVLGKLHSEADAAFVVAAHGAIPDLIRRLHEALDESDRLDEERDRQEGRIADLEFEADAQHEVIKSDEQRISELESKLETAREDADYYKAQWMEGR